MIYGKPNFEKIQARCTKTNGAKILLESSRFPACFIAYDIIYKQGSELIHLPLIERKKILSDTIEESPVLSTSRYIEQNGIKLYESVEKLELEGVVGKKKNSLYYFGKRTKDWKKIKRMLDDDLICIGYIKRSNQLISLILAKCNQYNCMQIVTHTRTSLSKLYQYGTCITNCPFYPIPKGYETNVI